MPRSASVGGLAKRGVIPRKQFYIKLLFYNTVILVLLCYKLRMPNDLPGRSYPGWKWVLLARLPNSLPRKFTALWLRRRFNTGQSRRGMTAHAGSCVRMWSATTSRAIGECSQYGGETKDGPLPSGEGVWRCLALRKLSSVECVTGPWRTEPHAPQRFVEHIEVDADDYPGGDPQNGQ
jgi:hypothetical protein